jgi:hypothetical protein
MYPCEACGKRDCAGDGLSALSVVHATTFLLLLPISVKFCMRQGFHLNSSNSSPKLFWNTKNKLFD